MIFLKNCAIIHIPKTGGNWVKEMVMHHVKNHNVSAKKRHIYTTHETPYTHLPVLALVREPAEFAHSLWHHRKNSTLKRFGYVKWDNTKELEARCGSLDYHTFMTNVAEYPNGVADYFKSYYSHYDNLVIGKMETMVDDLIKFLENNSEDFNKDKILESAFVFYNKNKKKKPLQQNYKNAINQANKDFCLQTGYNLD